MSTALMIIDAIICVALIASVVMQSGKSAGLSGSIGGGAESLFGGRARGLDQFLAKATMILGILFGLVTMALSVIMR
nr:preprotein translocase subunit SecG [uncultured Anaeromusa sp.]